MSCDEPQQLNLNIKCPVEHHGSQQYQRFIARMFELINTQLMNDEDDEDGPIVRELRNYAKFNDFPLVGAFVKQAMQIDLGEVHSDLKGVPPLRILTCFGKAFRGDEVGHIGRDILTPLLGHKLGEVRGAAITVLEGWLEYDEDGMWLEMVSDHLERETAPQHRIRCEHLVEQYDTTQDDMLLEMMNDCPECMEGHVLTMNGCWYCDNCGCNWGFDPIEHEYVKEDELINELEADPDELWNGDGEGPDELQPFFEVHRGAANGLRAVVETKKLPHLLASVLDLHQHLTLDFIESLNIGHLSVRTTNLDLLLHPLRHSEGHILRAWSVKEGFCLSIEPTATDDRWLVFMRY